MTIVGTSSSSDVEADAREGAGSPEEGSTEELSEFVEGRTAAPCARAALESSSELRLNSCEVGSKRRARHPNHPDAPCHTNVLSAVVKSFDLPAPVRKFIR
jgi:hypothetical protein